MGGGTERSHVVLGETSPRYNALRIQTSTRGMTIPVVFGTTRVTGNFLWVGDFRAVQHISYSRQWGGGKGGGGGYVNYTQQVSYTYQTAFAMGLCEGPIQNIYTMWSNKTKFSVLPEDIYIFLGSYPQLPWAYFTANHPSEALNYPGLAYIAFSSFNTGAEGSLPDMSFEVSGLCAPGILPEELVSNGNMSIGDPPTGWEAFNNPDVYQRSNYGRAGFGDNYSAYVLDSTPSYGGFRQFISTLPNGTIKFSFWCFVTQGVLDAILYDNDGITMIARNQVTTLNTWIFISLFGVSTKTGSTPIARFTSYWDTAVSEFRVQDASVRVADIDADPADIISSIIADPRHGLGLAGGPQWGLGVSSDLIDVVEYSIWCRASGFMLSPAFTEQALASDHIRRLLEETFSTAIYHDGEKLKFIPFADSETVGKSVTYTPNLTPLYDLDDDDFLVESGEDPILVKRKSPADCFNIGRIECLNRAQDYNPESIEVMDQASIDEFLARPSDSRKMWDICNVVQARKLLQLLVQRDLYVRNDYMFTLGWKYCHLEPMDIVTLTDSKLGMDKYPVRITEAEEDEEWRIHIIAEDFPEGIGNAALYETQQAQSYGKNWNVEPGNIIESFIFVPPHPEWANQAKPEIWIGVSGGPTWGGCDIYTSSDGETYGYAGTILGRPRIGSLVKVLNIGSDPDSENICSVDIAGSYGELLSGSQLEADNLTTLCVLLGAGLEFISYKTATLISSYQYDLIYLRRGAKGTDIRRHPIGTKFMRLDDTVARLAFDALWMHSVVYFKFCSFNIYKQNVQSLEDVEPYTFIIQNPLWDQMVAADSVSVFISKSVSDSATGADSISVSK